MAGLAPAEARLLRARRRRGRAGFTLIELMIVVVIIAALATLAIPSLTEQARARRTQNAAREVASLYRNARMRAMSRGSAVMVRFDASVDTEGRFEVREAVRSAQVDPNCDRLPISTCLTPTWASNALDNQLIGGFTTAGRSEYQSGDTKVLASSWIGSPAASTPTLDVCYTPLGRAFFRTAQAAAWASLTTVPTVKVQRTDASGGTYGLIRTVLVLPNGSARLGRAEIP